MYNMKALQLQRLDMSRVTMGKDDFIPLTPFGEEVEMRRGLLEEVTEECKATYRNDVVKVTVQVLHRMNSCLYIFISPIHLLSH